MAAAGEWGNRGLVLGLVAGILGCQQHAKSSLPPPLAKLGALASPQGEPVTLNLSPTGGQLALPGGAVLHVPPGALSEATKVTVARFDLSLDRLSFYVADAFAYHLSAKRSIAVISPPLRLDLPGDGAQVALAAVGESQWNRLPEYTGGASTVIIDHFSQHVFALAEPTAALTPTAALPADDAAAKKVGAANDFIRDHANQWERAFLGIDEIDAPTNLCEELKDLIIAKEKEWSFKFPEDVVSDPLFSAFHMGKFLFTSTSPSEVTSPERLFWLKTLPSQLRIRTRVLAADRKLTPADVLQIAVEENGNNAALGILAAHNFLKETTNEGRDMIVENFGDPFKGEIVVGPALRSDPGRAQTYEQNARSHGGEIAMKLRAWRSRDRSPAGSYDKMGPLYHVFAAMAATTFLPHIQGGAIAVSGEALMRATGITGDVADPEKGQADSCGKAVGDAVIKLFVDPNAVPSSDPPKPPPDSGMPSGLTCGLKTWNGDRCYFIRETPRFHCLPVSTGSTQYVWQEYKKDFRYWFLTVSYFARLGQFSSADHNNGAPTFTCQTSSMTETLGCLVAARNAEYSDCVDASKLGQKCIALYSLTDLCGMAKLSQTYFPQGTQSFDEMWAFIKAHAETNDSYDTPP